MLQHRIWCRRRRWQLIQWLLLRACGRRLGAPTAPRQLGSSGSLPIRPLGRSGSDPDPRWTSGRQLRLLRLPAALSRGSRRRRRQRGWFRSRQCSGGWCGSQGGRGRRRRPRRGPSSMCRSSRGEEAGYYLYIYIYICVLVNRLSIGQAIDTDGHRLTCQSFVNRCQSVKRLTPIDTD